MSDTTSRKTIASNAKKGFLTLSLRSIITYVLQLVSTLTLARLFTSIDYAIFGIVQNWIGSLSYLTDIGLTDSLTQQKDDISQQQVSAYLFIRVFISTILAMLFFIVVRLFPDLLGIQDYNYELISLLGSLSILEVLSSLPLLIFRKNMQFTLLAKVGVISTVFLYVTQILFAFLGFGFWSLFYGIAIRYFILVVYTFKYKLFSLPTFKSVFAVRHLFKTGAFFQLNLLVTFCSGLITPLLLNYYFDLSGVGFYYWATGLVSIPLALIFNFQNIAFPAIAKVQNDISEVRILTERSFIQLNIICSLLFGLGAALGPSLIDLLFNEKWYPAKELISLISLNVALYSIRQVPMVTLSSLGHSFKKFVSELSFIISLLIYVFFYVEKGFHIKTFVYANIFGNALAFFIALLFSYRYFTFKSYFKNALLMFLTMTFVSFVYYFKLSHNIFLSFSVFFIPYVLVCYFFEKSIFINLLRKLSSRFQ